MSSRGDYRPENAARSGQDPTVNPGADSAPPSAGGALGLFGGTFDPPHAGHIHLAQSAQAALGLGRVLFIPAARSPHKPPPEAPGAASATADRLALLEALCESRPSWSVSTVELERGGTSYMIETVEALAAAGELGSEPPCLLLGGDQLPGLHSWRRLEELLSRVRPIVVHRGRDARGQLAALEASLPPELAARVRAGFLDLPPVDISSTELRGHLERGVDPGPELPAEVLAVIRARSLYGFASPTDPPRAGPELKR
ncbi:MAG: nicotinate (nicotinamide) nucleotide adenylyltransferase [Planctomycetota bacterium]|nr:nicotinate (nicotinamide) nucleotide adenylyltransferase [Planctomycetota bacterium]